MSSELSANEIVELLDLEPNATCGSVRITYVAKETLPEGALPSPFARSSPIGSALYFLVTPEAPVRLHRIRNDQLYHYYLGDPLELFLLKGDGVSERVVVGPDLKSGQHVQFFIPGNTFHTARLLGRGRWFLGGSTEWPAWRRKTWRSAIWRRWRKVIRLSQRSCARLRRAREAPQPETSTVAFLKKVIGVGMDMKDERGLPLTAASGAAVAAVDFFTARLSRIDRGAEAILEAAKIFPATPMIQLSAAGFCLFGQTWESDAAAKAYLDAAGQLLASANERERMLHAAFLRWWSKDHLGAAALLEEITEAYPRDILAIKIAEFIYYILGQQHEGPRFLRHMQRVAAANAGDPDFLAAHGFAHELCGHADEAERLAEEALARDERVPWAHHCLAHVYLRRGEADVGVRRLEALLPLWMTAGRVIHCHNAWHLAVAYLDRLGLDEAEELLRSHVWGVTPDLTVEQLDAIALAWRIEMAGRRLDDIWPSLAERVEPRIDDCHMPFIHFHLIYALARAGRKEEVARCVARVRARGLANDAEALRSWRSVGIAVVEGSAAYGRGEPAECVRLLGPVIENVTLVGGSDAQIGLLRQTYLCSLIESGRKFEAAAYWRKETAEKSLTELDRHWLGLAAA